MTNCPDIATPTPIGPEPMRSPAPEGRRRLPTTSKRAGKAFGKAFGKPFGKAPFDKAQGKRAGKRAGLTLIEMMVAVTILVTIMLAFGMIMKQIQGVVSVGEKTMRANAAAAAIIGTIRGDISRATRDGMLCITQTSDDPAIPPMLVLTAAGVVRSKTDPLTANAALVAMGMCDNQATGKKEVLYYQRWLLAGPTATADDSFPMYMANLQTANRQFLGLSVPTGLYNAAPGIGMPPITLPCRSTDDIAPLWQVLSEQCEWLSIMWTYGKLDTTTGLTKWYGVRYDRIGNAYQVQGGSNPNNPDAWQGVIFDSNDTTQVEFDVGTSGRNVYRALWTHHNQNVWPKALKIRFQLKEYDSPYEVLCPIGG